MENLTKSQQKLVRFEQSFSEDGKLKSPIWIKDEFNRYTGYIKLTHGDPKEVPILSLHDVTKKELASGTDLRKLMAETIKEHSGNLREAAEERRKSKVLEKISEVQKEKAKVKEKDNGLER